MFGQNTPKNVNNNGNSNLEFHAEVEALLHNPPQVVAEDDVLVAQSKRGSGLLRVVFVEIGNTKRIVTLYRTNQVKRYWQEEADECEI